MSAPQFTVTPKELKYDHEFGSPIRDRLAQGFRLFVVGTPHFTIVQNGPALLLLDADEKPVGTYASLTAAIEILEERRQRLKRGRAQ